MEGQTTDGRTWRVSIVAATRLTISWRVEIGGVPIEPLLTTPVEPPITSALVRDSVRGMLALQGIAIAP